MTSSVMARVICHRFHTMIERSADPDTSSPPCRARALTLPLWPFRVAMQVARSRSHTKIMESSPPKKRTIELTTQINTHKEQPSRHLITRRLTQKILINNKLTQQALTTHEPASRLDMQPLLSALLFGFLLFDFARGSGRVGCGGNGGSDAPSTGAAH